MTAGAPLRASTAVKTSGKRILIVDDDPSYGPLVQQRLRVGGFNVEWAATGRTGLFKARFFKPSLILLDIHIPDLDGIVLHRALRSAPQTKGIPLLLLTAVDVMDSLLEAAVAGLKAEPVFRKLDGLDVLMERVELMLRPREPRPAPAAPPISSPSPHTAAGKPGAAAEPRHYDWNGLRLYPELRRMVADGKAVRLNTKEAVLLELFIRRPGVVYSSERLWEAAWPDSMSEGWRHTLDSRVSSLRRKLGKKWGRRLVCQKNEGYVFLPRSCQE